MKDLIRKNLATFLLIVAFLVLILVGVLTTKAAVPNAHIDASGHGLSVQTEVAPHTGTDRAN